MARTNSTPPVPKDWQTYINKIAHKYATGMFEKDDAKQVALEAFLRARNRYDAAKGPFEHYAKAAIYNALLNARIAEQRHWAPGDAPDGVTAVEIAPNDSLAEEEHLDAIIKREKAAAIIGWRDRLPSKPAALVDALYYRDLSQRDFAAQEGVTQARISQRNGALLTMARRDLAELRAG